MYRWHITPVKLAKMYKSDNKCWKCKESVGTFYHMWWECKKVRMYWDMIYHELRKMLRYNFVKKPEAFLLGIVGTDIEKKDIRLFQYATAAARILLAQKWKQEELPTKEEWTVKLTEYAEMDKLTGRIREQRDQKFIKDWLKFTNYLKDNLHLNTLIGFQEVL